jgi:hypothetical protein
LPTTRAQCNAQNVPDILFTVDNLGGNIGSYRARCYDTNGQPTAIEIAVDSSTLFGIGNNDYSRVDLVHNLIHEAMHSLDVQHPRNSEGALIATTASFPLSTSFGNGMRDLHRYDMQCANSSVSNGFRSLRPVSRYQYIGYSGFLGPGYGSYASGSGWNDDSGLMSAPIDQYIYDGNPLSWYLSSNQYNGLTMTRYAESPSTKRAYISQALETPSYSFSGRHYLRRMISSNDFLTSNSLNLFQCDSMLGFMTCNGAGLVYSAKRPQFAWDANVSRTHMVWTQQTRVASTERNILLATGEVINSTNKVPQPTDTGLRTHVAPDIACGGYLSAGNYDCILAYVPLNNTTGEIAVRRFWSAQGSTRYTPVIESIDHMLPSFGGQTAGSISAWHHNGNYYLAFRSENPGQYTHVMRSSDGAVWTFISLLDATWMAPGVVSNVGSLDAATITQWGI